MATLPTAAIPAEFQAAYFRVCPEYLRLSELLEHLPNTLFHAKDRDSRFVRMNAANLELYNATQEEAVLGKTDREFHPPSLAEAYIADDQRVMRRGELTPNQKWLIPHVDGRPRWFRCSKAPITNASGATIGVACLLDPIDTPTEEVDRLKRIAPAVTYLDSRFTESTPLEEVAELCDLSLTHFNRLFRELLRMTPSQYRCALRIQRAKKLLRTTDESVLNVAVDSGFFDHSHLTRHFKSATGLTPTAYRKAMRR